ncbi:MAG: MGMT family protein, partial [Acidimicrobiia bacterium]|nr:MGMT family protein [Acidimicrobiia bacterium]
MNDLEHALANFGAVSVPATSAARRFVDEAGQMIDIAYTTVDSPIGALILAATPRGLLRIGFDNETDVLAVLAERVSPRILEYPGRLASAQKELDEYFAGRRDHFHLPLDWALIGGFRRRILEVTARIPYGGVSTYQDVAGQAGQPKGARAAGQALGGNPI